jgi:hypothetical protein
VGSQEPDGKIGRPNFPIIALSCAVLEESMLLVGHRSEEVKRLGINFARGWIGVSVG